MVVQGKMKMRDIYRFLFTRLFGRTAGRTIFLCVMMLLGVGAAFVPFDGKGSDEYLLGVMICGYIPLFVCCLAFMLVSADVSGNRLMRSCPAAKALYTRGLTGACTLLCAVCAALTLGTRAAVTAVSGGDMSVLSDLMLELSLSFVLAAFVPLISMIRYGMIALIYLPMFEMLNAMFLSKDIMDNGFGAPIWAAALIMAGSIAVSAALSTVLCRLSYAKMNFKPYIQAQQLLTEGK